MLKENIQPFILKGYDNADQVNDDTRKIYIAHNHHIKTSEQSEFLKINRSFSICGTGLFQVTNRPNDREEYCT